MNEALEILRALMRQPPKAIALDLVDVLIVAYAIYRLLVIVKGTRAMQMGFGLALVFAIHQLSGAMGLRTLHTLLDTLLASIVLIVVVIFQSDIRRALMRFGRRPFFSPFKSSQETQVVEEVIKAATQLAHDRIGGLIVFERDAALDEFIEPGTVMDAQITKELLVSIFIPSHENPVHDGAVIVREGRIWQAGAFLPLTANPKLDRNLGTRHRAAIGISEETDAVVVVVSEERGQVSLCFNGNMVPRLDTAELRKVLLGLFSSRPRKSAPPPVRERTSIPPARPMPVAFTQPDDTGPIQVAAVRREESPPERELVGPLDEAPEHHTGPLRVRLDPDSMTLHEVVRPTPAPAPERRDPTDASISQQRSRDTGSASATSAEVRAEEPAPPKTEWREPSGRLEQRHDAPSGSASALALADAEVTASAEDEEAREIEPSGSPSASAIADAEATAAGEEDRES